MTKKIAACILAAVCLLGLSACKPKKPSSPTEVEKEWYRTISAYASGTMFRKSAVRVLFVNNAVAPGSSAAGLLEFSPSIEGTAEWKSPRELVFTPKGELKPGQEYKAVLHVKKILDLPKAFDRFEFRFGVVRPEMEVALDGRPGEVVFEAVHREDGATIHWHLDEQYIASTRVFHQISVNPEPGEHRLVLTDGEGRRLERTFRVVSPARRGN